MRRDGCRIRGRRWCVLLLSIARGLTGDEAAAKRSWLCRKLWIRILPEDQGQQCSHDARDLQLQHTCTQQNDRLCKEVFAIEAPPCFRMLCIGESAVYVRPTLVVAPGYSRPGSVGCPLSHVACLKHRRRQHVLPQVPAPYGRLCHALYCLVSANDCRARCVWLFLPSDRLFLRR